MQKRTIKDFPFTRKILKVTPDQSIGDAHNLLAQARFRHIPVVHGASGKLVGVVTDRDIKKYLSPFAGSKAATDRDNATLDVPIEKVMSKPPVSVKLDATISFAIETMLQRHIGCLPIVDDDERVLGIVTTSDLLRAYLAVL